MSEQVSTNPRVREPLTAPRSIQPWSAEVEADRLMDDLFSDIDQMLEGSSKLPTEPVKPEYISLRSIVMPQLTMQPAVMPPQEILPQPTPEVTEIASIEQIETNEAQTDSPRPKRLSWSFEKFLLAGGIASLVVTIVLLLLNQQKLNWPWLLNFASSPSAQKGKLSDSDAQFISYMQRSLEVIDRKTTAKSKTAQTGTNSTTTPPSVAIAGNSSLPPSQGTTVLERVYIPVYPPQAPWTPPATSSASRPAIPAPTIANSPQPLPSPVAIPSAPPSPQAAKPSPTPSALPPASVAVPTLPTVAPAAPAATHTLVGLLELGDRSAALFEINGITQRFNVGEAIGASGWTLVSVANQEAVIRRNGEVRSIYVGQKF